MRLKNAVWLASAVAAIVIVSPTYHADVYYFWLSLAAIVQTGRLLWQRDGPGRCYPFSMTTVEIVYRYAVPPTEQVATALARARDVYGIRQLSFDRAARTLRIEFDATRLNVAAVTKLLRESGLEIEPDFEPGVEPGVENAVPQPAAPAPPPPVPAA